MEISSFTEMELYQVAGQSITLGRVIIVGLIVLLLVLFYRHLGRRMMHSFYRRQEVSKPHRAKIRRLLIYIFSLLLALVLIIGLGFDLVLWKHEWSPADDPDQLRRAALPISTLLWAFLVFQVARLIDFVTSQVLIPYYYKRQETEQAFKVAPKQRSEDKASRTVQLLVYAVAIFILVSNYGLDYEFGTVGNGNAATPITISSIMSGLIILLAARLFIWGFLQFVLYNYYRKKGVPVGSQYAINQLAKYVIYIFALLIALQVAGFSLTLLLGGAAALLVGIGLGLQQLFNDLVSGVILLFERTVEIGDVVEVDGLIGTVRLIGIRTSLVSTRDNISVIVPNSKLISEQVINWSHYDNKARFNVAVGVAYGSDTAQVRQLLEKAARDNAYVLRQPEPFVRFVNFGDSSLDFELHFWSHEMIRIEDVKSDLRFAIDALFREHDISIPFPQRDVWMRDQNTSAQQSTSTD